MDIALAVRGLQAAAGGSGRRGLKAHWEGTARPSSMRLSSSIHHCFSICTPYAFSRLALRYGGRRLGGRRARRAHFVPPAAAPCGDTVDRLAAGAARAAAYCGLWWVCLPPLSRPPSARPALDARCDGNPSLHPSMTAGTHAAPGAAAASPPPPSLFRGCVVRFRTEGRYCLARVAGTRLDHGQVELQVQVRSAAALPCRSLRTPCRRGLPPCPAPLRDPSPLLLLRCRRASLACCPSSPCQIAARCRRMRRGRQWGAARRSSWHSGRRSRRPPASRCGTRAADSGSH